MARVRRASVFENTLILPEALVPLLFFLLIVGFEQGTYDILFWPRNQASENLRRFVAASAYEY